MRTRAYRPEVSDCLEDRSLLSGVAGVSADPVVVSRRQLKIVAEQYHLSFGLFARDIEVNHLTDELHDVVVMVPFGQVDGLGVSVKRIVDKMERDLSAKVPHAIRSALHDLLAVTRAGVEARVRAGDLVVR